MIDDKLIVKIKPDEGDFRNMETFRMHAQKNLKALRMTLMIAGLVFVGIGLFLHNNVGWGYLIIGLIGCLAGLAAVPLRVWTAKSGAAHAAGTLTITKKELRFKNAYGEKTFPWSDVQAYYEADSRLYLELKEAGKKDLSYLALAPDAFVKGSLAGVLRLAKSHDVPKG